MDQRCPLSDRPLAALPGPTVRVEVIAPTEPLPDIWLQAIPVDHPLLRPEWMHAARRSLPDGRGWRARAWSLVATCFPAAVPVDVAHAPGLAFAAPMWTRP